MDTVKRHIQAITGALVAADAADLGGMARVHTLLQELSAAVGAHAGSSEHASASSAINSMLSSVESIVLRQASDPVAVIEQMALGLDELQNALSRTGGAVQADAVKAAAPGMSQSAEMPVAAQGDADERVIAEADIPLVTEFIAESNGHLDTAEAALLELESSPGNPESINAVFRGFHTIKGVAGFLGLKQIGMLAHSAENLLDRARQGALELRGRAADLVLEALDAMRALLQALGTAVSAGRPQPKFGAVPGLIGRLNECASGGVASEPARPASTPTTEDTAPAHEDHPRGDEPASPAAAGARVESAQATVKVGTARLDSLVDLVGELLIAQSMVKQSTESLTAQNPVLGQRLTHLGKITRELQDLSMAMRMVPIQGVFQKMSRLARDVARKAGKKAELVTHGNETELDRNVVEAISDPLVHMVRNALDHGIEPPQERTAQGKPEAGRLELRAFHQGGNIVIQIEDDGRGLNTQKILRKAVAGGLVREGQTLSDPEIFALIFHAGLSTAEKVTDVSGRGVGMDVVKRNIEALRGRIEIASTPGKGSRFTIRLPLTLAMIDGMVVRVGRSRFVIPITGIEQTIQPKPSHLSTVQDRGELCLVRGRTLPLYRLADLLGLDGTRADPSQALAVILQDSGRSCCLLVDELLGQQQVVIKSLGRGIGPIKGVAGGAILGDGTVTLIAEISGLFDLAASAGAAGRPSSRSHDDGE